jgi:hypothetical protein
VIERLFRATGLLGLVAFVFHPIMWYTGIVHTKQGISHPTEEEKK